MPNGHPDSAQHREKLRTNLKIDVSVKDARQDHARTDDIAKLELSPQLSAIVAWDHSGKGQTAMTTGVKVGTGLFGSTQLSSNTEVSTGRGHLTICSKLHVKVLIPASVGFQMPLALELDSERGF
jgi:hypothetical protein